MAAYLEAARGLVDGGSDLIFIETIFDTLNAKAAIFAVETLFEEQGRRWPVVVSGTITDASGRTLSGQVTEAFWDSVRHVSPLAVGLNCALGAKEMRPYIAEMARLADSFVSCYPNAGLPNAFGEYDEAPDETAGIVGEFAEAGLVNLVGGCCGTTPEHIAAIARPSTASRSVSPRPLAPAMRLSGLEPFTITDDSLFVNVGERTNITGSARFRTLIKDGDYDTALSVAAQQVESGAQVIDVNMDEGMIDGVAAMDRFLKLVASEPDISRVPVMVDSSKWEVIEAGLKCVQGKAIVNSISLKEGEEPFLRQARLVRKYGAAAVVMAFDEDGQADSLERRKQICSRAYRLLTEEVGFPAEDIIFDPNVFAVATGIEEHASYGLDFIEATRWIKENLPGRQGLGRHLQRLVQLPRQQPGARGDPRRLPLPRHRAPASTWASSTPVPWPSTTRSTPSCASASRTSCSTADPTQPSGSSRSRRSTTRSVRPPRSARRSGAPCRSASASRTPSSRASTRTSRPTPSCSARRSPGAAGARSRSSRARSWTA